MNNEVAKIITEILTKLEKDIHVVFIQAEIKKEEEIEIYTADSKVFTIPWGDETQCKKIKEETEKEIEYAANELMYYCTFVKIKGSVLIDPQETKGYLCKKGKSIRTLEGGGIPVELHNKLVKFNLSCKNEE